MHAIASREHVTKLRAWRDRAVPHDVEAPTPHIDGPVGTGDGIADQLFAHRKTEIERRKAAFDKVRRGLALLEHSAPRQVPDVVRLHAREQCAANGRTHSVGADQQVPFKCRSIIQDRDCFILILGDIGDRPSGVEVLRRERLAKKIVQQRPRCTVLVILMCGEGGAATIIGDAPVNADADVGTYCHAGALKRGEQGSLRNDAGASRLQAPLGALEDLDRPPLANKHVAREHSAHRASDDNRPFHCLPRDAGPYLTRHSAFKGCSRLRSKTSSSHAERYVSAHYLPAVFGTDPCLTLPPDLVCRRSPELGVGDSEIPSEGRYALVLQNPGLIDRTAPRSECRNLGVPVVALVLARSVAYRRRVVPEQLVHGIDVVADERPLIAFERRDQLRKNLQDIDVLHF